MLASTGRRKKRKGVLTRLSDRFDGWWQKRKTGGEELSTEIKIDTPLAPDPTPVDLLDELKIAVPKRKYPGPRPRTKPGTNGNGQAVVLDETCRLPKVIAKHPEPGLDDCVSGQAGPFAGTEAGPAEEGGLEKAVRPRLLKKRLPPRPGHPRQPHGPRPNAKFSTETAEAPSASVTPPVRRVRKRDETEDAASADTPPVRPVRKRDETGEAASSTPVKRPLKKRVVKRDEASADPSAPRLRKKRPAPAPEPGIDQKPAGNQLPRDEAEPVAALETKSLSPTPQADEAQPDLKAAAAALEKPTEKTAQPEPDSEAQAPAETQTSAESPPDQKGAEPVSAEAAEPRAKIGSALFSGAGRKKTFLALGAALGLVLVGVAAYFGYSYYTDMTTPSAKVARIPAASLPRVAPLNPGVYELYAREQESSVVSEVTIAQGSSLGKSLEELGLGTRHQVTALIECLTTEAGLSVVRPGAVIQAYWLDRGQNELGRLEYHPATGGAPIVVMPKVGGGYWSYSLASPALTLSAAREGTVSSSLWEAGSKAGLDAGVIMTLSEILASDVDFFTDIKKGDSFQVLYSREYRDGRPQGTPIIDMVKLVNKGKEYEYYRFVNNQDQVGYFDQDGRSSHKTFFVTPLQFKRISSRFTMTRMHPIHKVVRPHQGVDYAAPSGTPVSTVADGTIIFAGWNGGYGRLITIQHDATYTTMYAHLSSFAPGIKKGSVVKQGDHIGNVGATGTATGPHLDFRLKKNGVFIDPIPELAKQQGKKLESGEYQAFVNSVVTTNRERMTRQLEANKLDGPDNAAI